MSTASKQLTESGYPNNILTRTCWIVACRTIYYGVTVVAFCTRKDRLEIVTALQNKLQHMIDSINSRK